MAPLTRHTSRSRRHRQVLGAAVLPIALAVMLAGCGGNTTILSTIGSPLATGNPAGSPAGSSTTGRVWMDSSKPIDQRVQALLGQMTLDEKIGQMTQIESNTATPEMVKSALLGSVLSGGDGGPQGAANTAENWYRMVDGYQQAALQTRLAIPILYGVDAVHGDAHVTGTTIFPQNVGLGATHDAALVQKACEITAAETSATGVRWAFAPVVAVPQDIRWGRTYEGYSENTDLVTQLGTACVKGLQGTDLSNPSSVVADPKHYLGDGGTAAGSSKTYGPNGQYLLDQGVDQMDNATIEKLFLPPYKSAVDNGARIVMVTFSSTKEGGKVTGDKHWVTDVLKTQLGFTGFVVSDWGAIDQVSSSYLDAVKQSINAGIDMSMVPQDGAKFESTLKTLAEANEVPQSRIDDAVSRILRVKFEMGLFEHPMPPSGAWSNVGSAANRAVARQAVAESAVLLKTSAGVFPIARTAGKVFVSGQGADDIGMASGGWTITWQGQAGQVTTGTTLVKALRDQLGDKVEYKADGSFAQGTKADVGIVVVAERPYAEGVGDSEDLQLPAGDTALVARMKAVANKVIVVVVSGRPMVLGDVLTQADAVVEAWLPGTEGEGLADVLLGDKAFTGTTPYTWPKSGDDAPRTGRAACDGAVFPFGYGLDTTGKTLGPAACAP